MKTVHVVLWDDIMNYLKIVRKVDGAEVFADVITAAHEYAAQINRGTPTADPAVVADQYYDKSESITAWTALSEMIASINRGVEAMKKQSETNAANVGKRITGELGEIYKGKIDEDVIAAVMNDAKVAEHPKQYAARIIDRLISEGKTTLEAYRQDTRDHERAKNPALNYQESDGIRDAVKNLGKDFYVDLGV